MSIEAMKQALEALCELEQDMFHPAKVFKHKPTITALRTAIEQAEKQEQEQVSHQGWCASLTQLLLSDPPQPALCNCTPPTAAQSQDIKSGIETVAAQGGLLPQQEPVAKKPCPACGGPLVECQHCEGEGYEPGTDNDVTGPALCRECGGLGGKRNTTPPAAQSQDLNGGHQLDVAGHASTATITKWSYRDCGSEGWFIAETVAAPGGLLPQQEPVALGDLLGAVARGWGHSKNAHKEMDSDLAIAIAEEVRALYVTQPAAQREWVGLTEIEICDIEAEELTSASSESFSFARAIEAKLKEKNT
jgi:hypothetical protein